MFAMEKYSNILLIGATFEKMEMFDNAKKIYEEYLNKVASDNFVDVLKFFRFTINECTSYEETINKAYLIENLNKLYKLIENYKFNWHNYTNNREADDDALMIFLRNIGRDNLLTNSNLAEIKNLINSLNRGVCFGIKVYDEKLSLLNIVKLICENKVIPNQYGNELSRL